MSTRYVLDHCDEVVTDVEHVVSVQNKHVDEVTWISDILRCNFAYARRSLVEDLASFELPSRRFELLTKALTSANFHQLHTDSIAVPFRGGLRVPVRYRSNLPAFGSADANVMRSRLVEPKHALHDGFPAISCGDDVSNEDRSGHGWQPSIEELGSALIYLRPNSQVAQTKLARADGVF